MRDGLQCDARLGQTISAPAGAESRIRVASRLALGETESMWLKKVSCGAAEVVPMYESTIRMLDSKARCLAGGTNRAAHGADMSSHEQATN